MRPPDPNRRREWESKRVSDRPTQRGGPIIRILAILAGGAFGAATSMLIGVRTLLQPWITLVIMGIGATIGMAIAWRAWNEAARDDD